MRDDDTFRLIDPDEAVALGCFLIALAALGNLFVEDKPTPQPVAQRACEITIAQYGPGERWVPKPPVLACAGAMVALPAHVLTSPVQESK